MNHRTDQPQKLKQHYFLYIKKWEVNFMREKTQMIFLLRELNVQEKHKMTPTAFFVGLNAQREQFDL